MSTAAMVYLIGAGVFFVLYLVGMVLVDYRAGKVDETTAFLCVLFSFLAAAMWPIVVPVQVLVWLINTLFGSPRVESKP